MPLAFDPTRDSHPGNPGLSPGIGRKRLLPIPRIGTWRKTRVPHRHHRHRAPRPRRRRRRLPTARLVRAGSRHRITLRGPGHRPDRQAAQAGSIRSSATRPPGPFGLTTTTSSGGSKSTSTGCSRGMRWRRPGSRATNGAIRSSSNPWPTGRSSSPSRSEVSLEQDHRDHRRPQGRRSRVETKGFSGGECREASRFVELALGTRSAETLTAEFHQSQQAGQELEQSP